ncbi:HAD-IA family hydrolase [Companilactobacillus halodurans]|uniref:HAD-IA family hydrolase n=1 Tax=Companilactobacillus halodurans TaxID=2584183 RepID=A0A5P0ZUX3_9LACO|nr:HAD-IA family hydrolase [Companilactobacillus halodurans]MQS76078.1 HAD-IA family hydrolase [Companilactobacillus halodurans]MQS96514.1 HAD-IA family hydrolase [Companilactobacillus halodurans]
MKSIVWDFDDTIANSYPGIVSATQKSLRENFGISLSKDTIFKEAKKTSIRRFVTDLLKDEEDQKQAVKVFYASYFRFEKEYHDKITLIPHVKNVLKYCDEKHYVQFIITHRDQSIYDLAKSLGIEHYFKEIVSVSDGFKRKPNPEMLNYLIDKYDLKSDGLWVIGDRQIDIEFGKGVGAHTILLNSEKVDFACDHQVSDLLDVEKII